MTVDPLLAGSIQVGDKVNCNAIGRNATGMPVIQKKIEQRGKEYCKLLIVEEQMAYKDGWDDQQLEKSCIFKAAKHKARPDTLLPTGRLTAMSVNSKVYHKAPQHQRDAGL